MAKRPGKLIALLAVIGMLVTLFGCSVTPTPAASPSAAATASAAATTAAPTAAPTAEPTAAPPEPVQLSFFGMNQGFTTGEQTDEVSKEVERLTGVTLICEACSDNPKEQLMAKLASGDLPDLLQLDGSEYLQQMITGGNLLALDDLIQTHGKDILANAPAKIAYSKKAYSAGTGKLYIIAAKSGPAVQSSNVPQAHYIRWDYYKELGCPTFQTDLDLIPILAQMQKNHPTNADGQKVYALSPFFDWGTFNFTMLAQIHGVDEWTLECEIDQFTGEVTSQADPNAWVWKNIQFYNKGYQAGILDPDCVTQSFSNFAEKAASGRALHTWWPDNVGDANAALSKLGPDVGFMPVLSQDTKDKELGSGGKPVGGPARLFCVPKNCKAPERAMDLLDFLNTYDAAELIYDGIKGKYWDLGTDGKPYLLDSTIQSSQTDPDFSNRTGINNKWTEMSGLWVGTVDPRYNTVVDLWSTSATGAKMMTPLQKDYCSHYNISVPTEYSYQARQGITEEMFQASGMMPATPDDMQKINDDMNKIIMTDGVKLMFAKSDAEFDAQKAAIIQKLKDAGADKLTDYVKQAIAQARATYQEMIKG